jgi:hypothetical protein
MPIIRSSKVLYRWLLPVLFGALVFKLSVWCGADNKERKKERTSFLPSVFSFFLSLSLCFLSFFPEEEEEENNFSSFLSPFFLLEEKKRDPQLHTIPAT